jgi:hypothetical protein
MAMQTSAYVDPSAGNMSVEVFAAKWISTQGAPETVDGGHL